MNLKNGAIQAPWLFVLLNEVAYNVNDTVSLAKGTAALRQRGCSRLMT